MLRLCAAPTQPHVAPLRGPTLLRPCAAPCRTPAQPHAAPLPLVPQPTEGPSSGAPAPLHTRPLQPGMRGAHAPARPPTPWSGALRAPADHRPVRPRRPAAARGRAPAWRRFHLGRPPLPTRPAPASAPRPRFQLAAGPAARIGARIGRADALAHAPPTARPARRPCPRRARRPHGVGLSGPPPAAARSAHTAPRPPRAPHPHGAASASAARRYPRARPMPRPPAGRAARPPAHGTQGRAPGDTPYIVPAPSTPLLHLRTGRSPHPCRGGVAAGSKGNRGPAGPRTGGPSIPPPIPPPFRTGAHALPPTGGDGTRVAWAGGPSHSDMRPPPPQTEGGTPSPPSVVVGTRPASVTPADCSLAPCPGRACLAISPAGTCWVPQQQQQQQYYIVPSYSIVYYTILYYGIPHCIVLWCIVLY